MKLVCQSPVVSLDIPRHHHSGMVWPPSGMFIRVRCLQE